jgi:hypothetical protein
MLLVAVILLCVYSILSMWIAARHLSTASEDGSSPGGSFFFFFGQQGGETNEQKEEQEFAACLLVMDDSHYLMEWLAYHYHAVNLRTLIIVADPKSQTSPRQVLDRWRDYIDIREWKDSDYGNPLEFQEALREVQQYFGPSVSPILAQHRARQRLFYYKCLQTLKRQGQHWTLLTDTDEFVTINYQIAREYNMTDHLQPPNQPGAVAHFVHEHARILPPSGMAFFSAPQQQQPPPQGQNSSSAGAIQPNAELLKDNPPLFMLQSSPCVQIPRIRFGAQESSPNEIQRRVPSVGGFYNGSDFLTLRWRSHTLAHEYQLNKISKTILDLSRIDMDELVPVNSIHLPVRSLCQQRRLHLRKSQSLLVIHHYLGSLEQYLYRENDARIQDQVRSLDQFEKQSAGASQQTDDDEIRPWLEGFHQNPPRPLRHILSTTTISAQSFVKEVGQLQPKSWTTYEGDPNQERCALLFFGLPRAFKSMVLPSIVKHVLIPNARHNCDVYVHFFEQYEEAAGRKNRGGTVDPHEVYLLEKAVQDVQDKYGPPPGARTYRTPTVSFTYDTEADFWKARGAIIAKFQNTTKPEDGLPMYFPYEARTYEKSSLNNIVRQWHSIEFAFKLMEITGRQMGVQYSRVGMLRSDVLYMTPIDIAMLDRGVIDSRNRHVVVAGFAMMPVNDRMVYGNYEAVKIWATHRFALVEERAKARQEPGYVMHSERFLNYTVFPEIWKAGYPVNVNKDICFVRTRADESAMISDCIMSGTTRGWGKINKLARVESIVQRNCTRFKMGVKWIFVGCGEGVKY